MLKRLFFALNECNGGLIDYTQSRQTYQASNGGYKLYVGGGNNAQLVVQQMFKENRWWWNVALQGASNNSQNAKAKDGKDANGGNGDSEYQEDEEADEGEMEARAVEKSGVSEDFKEQNMIWTQWKKYSLFPQLKTTQIIKEQASENKGDCIGELQT